MTDLEQAQENLAAAQVAYRRALEGKSYGINTGATAHNYTRQDIKDLLAQLQYWQGQVARLSGTRNRIKIGVSA